jgi:hypothetical protein
VNKARWQACLRRADRRCRLCWRVNALVQLEPLAGGCRCGTALNALAVDSVAAVALEAARNRFAEAGVITATLQLWLLTWLVSCL